MIALGFFSGILTNGLVKEAEAVGCTLQAVGLSSRVMKMKSHCPILSKKQDSNCLSCVFQLFKINYTVSMITEKVTCRR